MRNNLEKFIQQTWQITVAIGILSVLFGVFIFFWPTATITLIFSIFSLIIGIFATVKALGSTKTNRLWWMTLVFGVLCLSFGVYLLLNPNTAVLTFAIILSIIIFVQALSDLIAASYDEDSSSKIFFIVTGIIGFIIGFIILFYPETAAITFGWLVGAYIMFRGGSLLYYTYHTRIEFRNTVKKVRKAKISKNSKK